MLTNSIVGCGDYTPVLTPGPNVVNAVPGQCFVQRIGNVVSVFGTLRVTANAVDAQCNLDVTLPVPTNMNQTTDVTGMFTQYAPWENVVVGVIAAQIAWKRATIQWKASTDEERQYNFQFTYMVK